jgi:hypothetical protein
MSGIWKATSDFGVNEAKWYPYWRNQKIVKVNSESLKVSFYMRNKEILLVASNLTGQGIQGQISIDSKTLSLANEFTSASNAITGEQIKLENNTLHLSLLSMRANLILIK